MGDGVKLGMGVGQMGVVDGWGVGLDKGVVEGGTEGVSVGSSVGVGLGRGVFVGVLDGGIGVLVLVGS